METDSDRNYKSIRTFEEGVLYNVVAQYITDAEYNYIIRENIIPKGFKNQDIYVDYKTALAHDLDFITAKNMMKLGSGKVDFILLRNERSEKEPVNYVEAKRSWRDLTEVKRKRLSRIFRDLKIEPKVLNETGIDTFLEKYDELTKQGSIVLPSPTSFLKDINMGEDKNGTTK